MEEIIEVEEKWKQGLGLSAAERPQGSLGIDLRSGRELTVFYALGLSLHLFFMQLQIPGYNVLPSVLTGLCCCTITV